MSQLWGGEGSLDDLGYVAKLRDLLDDRPLPADEQFSPNGTGTKFKAQRLKVNDDAYLAVTVDNVTVNIAASLDTLTTGQVFVDYDTGMLTFAAAPPPGVNTVILYHNQVRWRDKVLFNALYDGLNSLFPVIWRNAMDTSILMRTLTWDYPLPSDFNDPRVRIRRLSIREIPSSTNRFRPLNATYSVYGNPPMLRVTPSQFFSPGATLQIEYAAPYRTLSDLEPQAASLPLWYAAGMLLGFGEVRRTKLDQQTVMADQSAQPPGFQQNSGGWFMSQYRTLKSQLARPMGAQRPVSTYSF